MSGMIRTGFTLLAIALLVLLPLEPIAPLPRPVHDGPGGMQPPPGATVAPSSAAPLATQQRARQAFGTLPLFFIENRGQTDARVAYYLQGGSTTLYFTSQGVTYALTGPADRSARTQPSRRWAVRKAVASAGLPGRGKQDPSDAVQRWAVKLDFLGARPDVRPIGQDMMPTVISYFKGPEARWKTGLKTYGTVMYPDLWPGIDLVYSAGRSRQVKYTFVVKPGADPRQIRLAYRGATAVRVNDRGQMEVSTPVATLVDDRPVSYQEIDGQRVEVASAYALEVGPAGATGYGFRVGAYDARSALMIDPIIYAGYIGGSNREPQEDSGIAVDSAGNAYVASSTWSDQLTFPEKVGPDLTFNGFVDAFVAKVSADGKTLVYAGYIGGDWDDEAAGVAVDVAGRAYVTGYTTSKGTFPVTVGPDLTFGGDWDDAFVLRVSADGTKLDYSGYIGGSGNDRGYGIAIDAAGNAYVTGSTRSPHTSFPVKVGPDVTHNGDSDAFVAKVKADGSGFVYAGYIGGGASDIGWGIAVDASGAAYVAGDTGSDQATFPVVFGPDTTYNGGEKDAFVAKVHPSGQWLQYAGYIGGASLDHGLAIAVDSNKYAYVTGRTHSSETSFPVKGGPDLTHGGTVLADAFVAKVTQDGVGLVYAGFIGGSGQDRGFGIAVDSTGHAYVVGETFSNQATFPVKVGPDVSYNGGVDAFLARVSIDGTVLLYAGYIGGAGVDLGYGIAVSGTNAYVTGFTKSSESTFPDKVGPDLTWNGDFDVFVAKIATVTRSIGLSIKPADAINSIDLTTQDLVPLAVFTTATSMPPRSSRAPCISPGRRR